MKNRLVPAFVPVLTALLAAGTPDVLAAQVWKAVESLRLTAPTPADSAFAEVRGVAVAPSGSFYVLDRERAALFGFSAGGDLLWKTSVPFRPNPMLAVLRDTAALRELVGALPDSAFPGRSDRAGRGGRAGRASLPPGAGGRGIAGRGAGGMAGLASLASPERLDSLSMGIGGAVVSLAGGELAVVDPIGRQAMVFDTTGAQLRSDGFFNMMDAPMQWACLGPDLVATTRSVTDMMSGMMSGKPGDSNVAVKIMPTSHGTEREIMRIAMPAPVSVDPQTMTIRISTHPPMLLMTSTCSRLFVANNQQYRIAMYDSTGTRLGTLQRSVARMPMTAADRMRTKREFAQMMDSIPPIIRQQMKMEPSVADSLPAIQQIAAGDSMLLVRRGSIVSRDATVQAANTSRWDIIGFDNAYRGYVDLPSSFSVTAIQAGKLYGTWVKGPQRAVVVMTLTPPSTRTR